MPGKLHVMEFSAESGRQLRTDRKAPDPRPQARNVYAAIKTSSNYRNAAEESRGDRKASGRRPQAAKSLLTKAFLCYMREKLYPSQVDGSTFPCGKAAKDTGGAERLENCPVDSFQ